MCISPSWGRQRPCPFSLHLSYCVCRCHVHIPFMKLSRTMSLLSCRWSRKTTLPFAQVSWPAFVTTCHQRVKWRPVQFGICFFTILYQSFKVPVPWCASDRIYDVYFILKKIGKVHFRSVFRQLFVGQASILPSTSLKTMQPMWPLG